MNSISYLLILCVLYPLELTVRSKSTEDVRSGGGRETKDGGGESGCRIVAPIRGLPNVKVSYATLAVVTDSTG